MEQLAGQIAAAINVYALYPPQHPRVVESLGRVVTVLHDTLEETRADAITYLIVGDDLVVDDEVIRKTNLSVDQFVVTLRQKGIERLTLAPGLEVDEVRTFIASLAGTGAVRPSPHIVVGQVRVVMEDEKSEKERHKPLTVEQLEIVRAAWARYRVEKRLPIDQLEELVWSLIESVGSTTRAMLPLAPLREHDEYTFVHSVNVSLLVLAQARSFGLWGAMLHAFGLAALLHDIGKLSVPLQVLNKPGKLEAEEWETMKRHCHEGAWSLTEIDGASPLSVIVAFEHHLRFDGRPNYPMLRTSRLPNLASRMTAIADTYDAMMTIRPYQQPLGRAAAVEMLKMRAGTFYDPMLVGNFVRLLEANASRLTAAEG